jgi:potassium-transporting ATPase KdpC subunit
MKTLLRPCLVLLALFTALTGLAYPALVTALAQAAFPGQANGSQVKVGGTSVGSALIGQPFDDPRYFWGRPSATAPTAYNGAASTGSNLGPTNPALRDAVAARIAELRKANPEAPAAIPVELVTASASGLDPHLSPAGALYQVPRVARARGLPEAEVRALALAHVEPRTLGVLGEPRVNVLQLNLALDRSGH